MNFIGTDGADTFGGTPDDDKAYGGGGNDTLSGGAGNDTLDGGFNQDWLDGGDGDDVIYGGYGGDVLMGGAGNDTLDGQIGPDRVYGGDGDDQITLYADQITLHADSVLIDGGNGFDRIRIDLENVTDDIVVDLRAAATATGTTIGGTLVRNIEKIQGQSILTGSGADTLIIDMPATDLSWYDFGGDATLVISLATATTAIHSVINGLNIGDYDLLTGGDMNFHLRTSRPVAGNRFDITGGSAGDELTGEGRDDALRGNSGDDVLTGQDGNDWLDGGTGRDSMIGGQGNDTYYVDNPFDQVFELLNQGADTVYSSIDFIMGATEIETVYLTGSDNIKLIANAGVTSVIGNAGDNLIDGGAGGDTLAGGGGNDTYYVDDAFDRVIEFNNQGWDTVYSTVSFTIGSSYVETVTLTGSANIDATGNSFANWLAGNSGNNRLYGGLGADTMAGGAGDDSYSVENAGDVVTEWAGGGVDTVITTLSYILGDNLENLTLAGSDAVNGTGNAVDNIIFGNGNANVLNGNGGNDTLAGRGGDDFYYYNAGVSIIERAGEGHDTVYSSAAIYRMGANLEDLYLTGGRTGVGNGLSNLIVGDGGRNFIDGGAGNDTLTGGTGIDNFIFGAGSGADVITDFDTVYPDRFSDFDRIDVSAYSHGVAWGGGITISQSGADTLIDLGGGNMVMVLNTTASDVVRLMVW